MARYEYDGAKVQSALFSLQAASNALNGIEADLSSAVSKIEQEVAQRGMGQIEVPRDAIVAAPGEAQSMISQLLGLISDKDAQLAEYFNKSSIGRFFYSVGMGINDTFGKSGKAEDLLKYFKIDKNAIIEAILKK